MTRWRRSIRSSGCSCSAARPRNSRPSRRPRSTDRRCGGSSSALLGGELTELTFAQTGRRLDEGRGRKCRRARSRGALRRLGDAHAPTASAMHKGGVLFKVPHKIDPLHLIPVETETVDGVTMLKLPDVASARARRLCADRSGHRPRRRARPRQLLHLVPQPGQGLLLARASRRNPASSRRAPFGVVLAGCPLDEKISEMNLAETAGPHRRRARHRRSSTTRCAPPPATASATTA